MDTVWVEQEECPDYYCGCGGGHIVAIYDSPHDGCIEVKLNELRRYDYVQKADGEWEQTSWT